MDARLLQLQDVKSSEKWDQEHLDKLANYADVAALLLSKLEAASGINQVKKQPKGKTKVYAGLRFYSYAVDRRKTRSK